MKFHHKYKLKKDTPKYKKGWPLSWCGGAEKFYFCKVSPWKHDKGKPDIYLDLEHHGYTVEEIKNTEWFSPVGKECDFIPPFPSKGAIEEFTNLDFEMHLVQDVDECRAMSNLFEREAFKDKLYEFVKNEYNKYYKLGGTNEN